ncbi:MAG: hypothetical protein ACD_50C00384G0001 [uncultured bacterium]|nr:MAG: hypothetical protein ACD_50C00384G0001 [uncultured bacterium]
MKVDIPISIQVICSLLLCLVFPNTSSNPFSIGAEKTLPKNYFQARQIIPKNYLYLVSEDLKKVASENISIEKVNIDLVFENATPTFFICGSTKASDNIFEFLNALNQSEYFMNSFLNFTEEIPTDADDYIIRFGVSGLITLPKKNE